MFLTILFALICWMGEDENRSVVHGETYVMNIPEGWMPGTGETMAGKPFRRKVAGYDVSTTSQ